MLHLFLRFLHRSQLHEYFVLIPEPIQRYLREVKEQLMLLLEWPDEELGVDEKLAFFRWGG